MKRTATTAHYLSMNTQTADPSGNKLRAALLPKPTANRALAPCCACLALCVLIYVVLR